VDNLIAINRTPARFGILVCQPCGSFLHIIFIFCVNDGCLPLECQHADELCDLNHLYLKMVEIEICIVLNKIIVADNKCDCLIY